MVTDSGQVGTPMGTAVLFIIFNRPDTTQQVFDAIRRARPPRLYLAGDGPRAGRADDAERVLRTREVVKAVDWPCEVHTLFRSQNLGCKQAVSGAIDWFFANETEGIILEDDCLPHAEFFAYCEHLLERYRDDERIVAITGNNFQDGQWRGDGSYYFSRYNHIWGWASWRRAWTTYDVSMGFWPGMKRSPQWRTLLPDVVERLYWERQFDRTFAGDVDTWDYQWTASAWSRAGLTATPNRNLVTNIGFGSDATHTTHSGSTLANLPTRALGALRHPTSMARDVAADAYTFDRAFGGARYRFPNALYHVPARLIGMVVRTLRRRIP